MLCLPNYVNNPTMSALMGGFITLFLFYLSSYSAMLPVAVFVSLTISFLIYYLMGGQIMCTNSNSDYSDNSDNSDLSNLKYTSI